MKKMALQLFCVLIAGLLLVPTSSAPGLDDWEDGDEEEITGHSFDEELWTAEVSNETENGNATFVISYVNYENVQAFLVAFKTFENDNGTGTLPYQMYGMHYFTPDGEEVFIGALLAFLMVYDDFNNNSIPNPDLPDNENIYYVIPFGVAESLNESGSYEPIVTPIPATEIEEGHYQFGMRYQNLYAYVSKNPILGIAIKTGWIAKFSELTITYDITIDAETGEVKTETYYTIGQVTELWGFLFGWPVKADPSELPDSLGISAVHFVTIFTSKYKVTGETSGNTLSPTATELADENVSIAVGEKNERAFAIRFMGEFDLIDEDTGNTTEEDLPAYNILVQAKFNDLALVWWQLGFSAALMSVFAYGLSENVQEKYTSPRDLAQKSLNPFNPDGFGVRALWYAVCFPSWNGLRVEHDPVYTAYFGEAPSEKEEGICGAGALIFAGAVCIPSAGVVSKKTKRKKKI
jgi:hypothetical protein